MEKIAKRVIHRRNLAGEEAMRTLAYCNNGETSKKTDSGTAFITTTDFAQVADWDAILGFIKKNEAWGMLEKRVAKNAIRGYIDEHKEVPNGVNYGTRIDINVRKPVAKVD